MSDRPGVGSAGELWAELTRQISGLYDVVMGEIDDEGPLAAEGLRYLLRYLAAGITTCVEFDDTVHPEFGCLIENRRSWGLDNPDTKYSFTRVEPGAVYEISGDPGTATELEIQLDTGHFADGRFTEWEALRRWRRGAGDLPLDGAGQVRFTFTAPAGASYLHLREYFGDWETEIPATLVVERADSPLPPLPLLLSTMASRMELLGLWLTAGASCWADLGTGLASGEPGPVTPFVPPSSATGLGGQAYGMASYACRSDQAVMLELMPPRCRYWSVSLATWFWESPDISNRQCSLNHTQAVPDDDGVVRFVLAQDDPGVANWLDPAGHVKGTLALRLLDADADTLPTLSYRAVDLADLKDQLGPGTARFSAPERTESLRQRRRAVARRYRR